MKAKKAKFEPNSFLNREVVVTYKDFCTYIRRIKAIFDFESELAKLRKPTDKDEFTLFYPTMIDDVVDLLEMIMNDLENHWISYYIYDLNFGEKYKKGDVTIDGDEYPLRNVKDLWELLLFGRGD
jgi:hypothetical protein